MPDTPPHARPGEPAAGARAGTATQQRSSAILQLSDVHVTIGGSHILQGIDAEVRRGGVTALLGRNGVGKTTTVKAILGLVPATGTIRMDGHRIDSMPTHAIVRRGIGYVPEDREVFAGLTVEENLKLAEPPQGTPDYERAYGLFPDLYQRRRQRAGTLSGGQQQMLAIGRVLLGETDLLLVDEPTKGLAPLLVDQVGDALTTIAEHTTVLLVEQNLPLVRRIASDVIVIDTGRVVHASAADDLLTDTDLVNRLLGVAGTPGPAASGQKSSPPAGSTDDKPANGKHPNGNPPAGNGPAGKPSAGNGPAGNGPEGTPLEGPAT